MMTDEDRASGRATHEQSQQAVSAVPVGIPDAIDFDLAFEAASRPEEELSLSWIALGVDRQGEAYVMDADPDFFKVDLLPEFWACDNGIEYPEGLASGLYLMTDVVIRPDSCGDPTFKGTIKAIATVAQGIAAGTDETPQAVRPEGQKPAPEGDAP